jgi:hypothetical protein
MQLFWHGRQHRECCQIQYLTTSKLPDFPIPKTVHVLGSGNFIKIIHIHFHKSWIKSGMYPLLVREVLKLLQWQYKTMTMSVMKPSAPIQGRPSCHQGEDKEIGKYREGKEKVEEKECQTV